MANNKIIFGDEVLIDLTEDTITPDKLAEGITAHDKTGSSIVGTMTAGPSIKKIGSYSGNANIDISAYPGATIDNFLIEVTSIGNGSGNIYNYAWTNYTEQIGGNVSTSGSITKSISGNVLTVNATFGASGYAYGVTTQIYGYMGCSSSVSYNVYYIS